MDKTPILYHGTDARFVRMDKGERMKYLNKCKQIIDYFWEIFQPLWQKMEQTVTLPNGVKIHDTSSRKIEHLNSLFINVGEHELYNRLLSRLSMVDSWKNDSKWYQYDFLCVTGDKEKAERYAKRSFAGGELGYIAYDLICGAEFLDLIDDSFPQELMVFINTIKINSLPKYRQPVVVVINDMELQNLYFETTDKPVDDFELIPYGSFKYKADYNLSLENAYPVTE